jgi:hypothetical protein
LSYFSIPVELATHGKKYNLIEKDDSWKLFKRITRRELQPSSAPGGARQATFVSLLDTH